MWFIEREMCVTAYILIGAFGVSWKNDQACPFHQAFSTCTIDHATLGAWDLGDMRILFVVER